MYLSHESRSHLPRSEEDGDQNGDDILEVDHAESDRMCAFKVAHTNKQEVVGWRNWQFCRYSLFRPWLADPDLTKLR